MDDESYSYLKRKILKLTQLNLDDYKDKQMRRRITTYLEHSGKENVVEFCNLLEYDNTFLRKLLDFLTINVSEFFRDTHLFDKLQTAVIPKLLTNTKELNVWSAGCSRGQEPYTIAMMLEALVPSVKYRILATDIDEGALQYAMAGGPYTRDDIKNIPEKWLNKYLVKSEDKYFLKPVLKTHIEFKQQNVLRDHFEKNFDLIICRNVTIYFTEEAKHELNVKFYHSLKNEGVLFIGGTEVMLDAYKIGFSGIGVCFYQKQEKNTVDKNSISVKIPIKV